MLWSPTIRAALIAGTPWLDVFCPGCGTSRAIDLRKVDRHPLASVATLVLGLRCSWCPESAPMPRILGYTHCHLRQRRRRRTCEPGRNWALLPFAFDSRTPPLPCFLGSGGRLSLLGGLRQIAFIGLSFNLRDIAAEKIGDVMDVAAPGKSTIQVE
jgi:hypothetical protein